MLWVRIYRMDCIEKLGGIIVQITVSERGRYGQDGQDWGVMKPNVAYGYGVTLMSVNLLWGITAGVYSEAA